MSCWLLASLYSINFKFTPSMSSVALLHPKQTGLGGERDTCYMQVRDYFLLVCISLPNRQYMSKNNVTTIPMLNSFKNLVKTDRMLKLFLS